MKALSTIFLSVLAAFMLVCAVVLTIDGNLARILGWYRFEPGRPLFSDANMERIDEVNWMRISDLHDRIECERDENGVWWIIYPFRDRMSEQAAYGILNFTAQARLVDTLPLSVSTDKERAREFGVETSPIHVTLKVPTDESHHTTVARYTLGNESPWYESVGDGQTVVRTNYLSTDFYSDDKRIHVVTGNLRSVFQNGLYALRDPKPLRFHPQQLRRLTIARPSHPGEAPLSLERSDAKAAWRITGPIRAAADQPKVDKLISSLASLTALKVDDESAVELPETPEYCIELESEGSEESPKLLIYPSFTSPSDERQLCYAKVTDRPVVFTLQARRAIKKVPAYADIITAVTSVPVLPEQEMAGLLSGSGIVYIDELPLQLDSLRSLLFTDKVDVKDISRIMLISGFSSAPLFLRQIPGNAESGVQDVWLYSAEGQREAEADPTKVKQLAIGLSSIPVERVLKDIGPGEDAGAAMRSFELDRPDYTLVMVPTPCALRATLFGQDMPLLRDRSPRTFLIKRRIDPETQRSMWVGMEEGGNKICELSTALTRQLSTRSTYWASRSLFHFPISALQHLTLSDGTATLELQYDYIGDSWSGNVNGQDVSPQINPHRSTFYLRQVQHLQVDSWLERGDPDAIKALLKPAFTVTLDLEMTDYSSAEAVVIEQADDVSSSGMPLDAGTMTNKELAQEMLTEKGETDEAMRRLAMDELPVIKKTYTLEIAPSGADFFYGRIRETGELFILNSKIGNALLSAGLLDP